MKKYVSIASSSGMLEVQMNSYYQSVLKDLMKLMMEEDYDQASRLIDSELSLPYVPQDAQQVLEEARNECKNHLWQRPHDNRQEIENWVSGTTRQKETAASMLQAMNLRDYVPEVQKLLHAPDLLQEFKGELIEALMKQKVDDEFTMSKNGMDITFDPSLITPADQDPVLKKTRKYFQDWLMAENPGLAAFCEQLLDQEILENRPFDFEAEDPKRLAAAIVRLVYEAMHDEQGWEQFAMKQGLEAQDKYPIQIKERGDYSL